MTEQTMLVHMVRADEVDAQGDLFTRAALEKAATEAAGAPVLDEKGEQIGKVLSAWLDAHGQVWIKADAGKGVTIAGIKTNSVALDSISKAMIHRDIEFVSFTATWLTEFGVLQELLVMIDSGLADDGVKLGPSARPPEDRKECKMSFTFTNPLYSVAHAVEPGVQAVLAAFGLDWLTVVIKLGAEESGQ